MHKSELEFLNKIKIGKLYLEKSEAKIKSQIKSAEEIVTGWSQLNEVNYRQS